MIKSKKVTTGSWLLRDFWKTVDRKYNTNRCAVFHRSTKYSSHSHRVENEWSLVVIRTTSGKHFIFVCVGTTEMAAH